MDVKKLLQLNIVLSIFCCFLYAPLAFSAQGEPPENIDFIGGYYENGEYLCYSEPCFTLHKGKGAASARVRPFEIREWLPRRGDEWSCQQAYTDILAKTSLVEVTYFTKKSCKLISNGKWLDTYTGKKIDGMKLISIDQRISLKEAHSYGGAFWKRSKRMAFAYSPLNLIPVTAKEKKIRNGQPASAWMPEDKRSWCDYVVHREIVARKFNLVIPMQEIMHNKRIKQLYCKF